MWSSESGPGKNKTKITVIGAVSLVLHIILVCFSITVISICINKRSSTLQDHLNNDTQIYCGKMDKMIFFGLTGIFLVLGVLGIVSSILLIIGLKYDKPGYVLVYLCYMVQMSIVLVITGLLFILKGHWRFAIATFCLTVLTSSISITVSKVYEAMMQNALVNSQNSISDLTLLIEEDLSEDQSTPA